MHQRLQYVLAAAAAAAAVVVVQSLYTVALSRFGILQQQRSQR
jgi:hypothetical protein